MNKTFKTTPRSREMQKYKNLIKEQQKQYKIVKFVNACISPWAFSVNRRHGLIEMLKSLKVDETSRK